MRLMVSRHKVCVHGDVEGVRWEVYYHAAAMQVQWRF